MLKDFFIKQGIKEAQIEEFIRKEFPMGDYSKTELQRTPLGIKIVIYTNKPGRIIGKGGATINSITDAISERFGFEKPQVDVKTVRNPDLDAKIVAKQIASALEKGYNYKKIGNLTIKRVMGAGAIGAQIIISGCMGGSKSATGKFTEGYMKHCGQPAKELVDHGHEVAYTKRSTIGVSVKIMKEFMDITGERRATREPARPGPGETEGGKGEPEDGGPEKGDKKEKNRGKKPAPKKENEQTSKKGPAKAGKKAKPKASVQKKG